LAALYLFDEASGSRVRDEVSRANSFYMPDRYIVLAQSLLSSPSFDNYLDIVLNIIGFMPLGFMLCGYLGMRGAIGASFAKTVLLCGLFSLLIESLQWFLPTRDSDMTDVITNIAGSAVGALLYTVSRRWLVSLGKLTQ
jgi:glycopeptide antibiotics resistance protein